MAQNQAHPSSPASTRSSRSRAPTRRRHATTAEPAHPANNTSPGTTDAEIRRVPNSQLPRGSSWVSQIRVPARSPITSPVWSR